MPAARQCSWTSRRAAELSNASMTTPEPLRRVLALRSFSSFATASISMPAARNSRARRRLDLPRADLGLAVELRAGVVLLDPVAVDDLPSADALARQVIGQERAQRPGAAEGHRHRIPIGPEDRLRDRCAHDAAGRPLACSPIIGLGILSGFGRVELPVEVRPEAAIADPNGGTGDLGLPQHADHALQVEVAVLTAQADAGDLDRQVVARDDRDMPAAIDLVGDPVDVAALLVFAELGARVCAGPRGAASRRDRAGPRPRPRASARSSAGRPLVPRRSGRAGSTARARPSGRATRAGRPPSRDPAAGPARRTSTGRRRTA